MLAGTKTDERQMKAQSAIWIHFTVPQGDMASETERLTKCVYVLGKWTEVEMKLSENEMNESEINFFDNYASKNNDVMGIFLPISL